MVIASSSEVLSPTRWYRDGIYPGFGGACVCMAGMWGRTDERTNDQTRELGYNSWAECNATSRFSTPKAVLGVSILTRHILLDTKGKSGCPSSTG